MATAKAKDGGVEHVVDADGTHHIGVKVDGSFVPFVSVAAYRVEQLRESAANTSEPDNDDDEGGDS